MPDVTSNPVTTRLTGTRTFDVGPGWPHTETDTVPWATLTAGDVINIHHRAAPYQKFGIRAQGTSGNHVIINGVTDSNGNRPIIGGQTRTAAGCNPGNANDVFSDTPAYGESLGVIVVKRGVNDSYFTYKPKYIDIRNLEVRGASNGTSYTTLTGSSASYSGAAAIYLAPSADVTVDNCVLTDCAFGLFTMAKDEILSQACERIALRNSRIFGNGVSGSYYEHNVYMQSTNPLVEGNYIGKVRPGSEGSSYKSRSSGEVFRYNFVEASARAIDFVHSEEQSTDGIATQPDYGTDYCYGNVIINDGTAFNPIHYGGDNLGEEDGSTSPTLPSNTSQYRSHLYFWNNTVYQNTSTWRVTFVQLSLTSTVCDAWNNIIRFAGTSQITALLANAGILNLRGTNLISGSNADHVETAQPGRSVVNRLGTIISTEPQFINPAARDVSLASTSPAIDQAGAVPPGLPSSIGTHHPVQNQPRTAMNGTFTRSVQGTALDLGSLEYGIGGGTSSTAPFNINPPALSGSTTVGSLITVNVGTWTGAPLTFTYRWNRNGSAISGAIDSSYVLQSADAGTTISCTVTAINSIGSTAATSAGLSVTGSPSGALGPDSQGVFTWDHANGTSLQAVNSKWEDVAGTTSFDLECQGNQLRCKTGTVVNGRIYVYKNGQGADQCSKTRVAAGGLTNGGQIDLYLNHQSSPAGYWCLITSTTVQIRRQGVYLHQFNHGINLSTTAAVFEFRKVGSNLTVKVNSTTAYSYSDSSPISGGWPGLSVGSTTGNVTDAQVDAWTDNAAASLSGAPFNTVLPALSGTPTSGSALNCSTGSWLYGPTAYAYQWKRNGTNISGATTSSYTLQAADVGTSVSCTVTASNSNGAASATSASVAVTAGGAAPVNTALPTLSGVPNAGSTLTCSTGAWANSPTSYTYQWRRNGSTLSGATSSTYLLQTADAGSTITCTVTATNSIGSASATSAGVSVSGGSGGALGPDSQGIFTWDHANGTSLQAVNSKWEDVAGTTSFDLECQGNQLRCKTGTVVNGRIYVYKNGQGADQCSKTRVAAGGLTNGGQIDLYLNHQSSPAGYWCLITSTTVQIRRQGVYLHQFNHGINLSTTAAVFEFRKVGSNLTVKVNSTTAYSYSDSSPINGGWPGLSVGSTTGNVTDAQVDAWTDNAAASLSGIPVNTVLPMISGTPTSGSTLSCTTGTWTYSPTSFGYQWKRNGTNIAGATNSAYLLQAADVGTNVSCTVTATNSNGSASATSPGISVTAGGSAPTNTTAPVLSGTATVGATLVCSTGTWSGSPTSYSYQWRRGSTSINGATGSTYMLTTSDAGATVSCAVTAGNPYGTTIATSNSVSVTGGAGSALGPDTNGVFTWNHTNGTSLQTVNVKWEDVNGTSSFDLECQSNQLRCKAGTAVNGRVYVYKNGQSADQCSKARIPAGGIAGPGHVFLYVNHRDSAIGYYIFIDASVIQLRRQGVFVHQFVHGVNLSTTSAVFELRKVASTITIKVDSTTAHTYTDSAPINGGWPGLALESSTGIVTDARIDAWTDNASASL